MHSFPRFNGEYNNTGYTKFYYLKKEDLTHLPQAKGKAITEDLITAKAFYEGYSVFGELLFKDDPKRTEAGVRFSVKVSGVAPVDKPEYLAIFEEMVHNEWILLVVDNNGRIKLCGTQDKGLQFLYKTEGVGYRFEFSGEFDTAPPFYFKNFAVDSTIITQAGYTPPSFTSGVNSLNGLAAINQHFSVGSNGVDVNWSSALDTHTLNIPNAGDGIDRGLVTNQAQVFKGVKTVDNGFTVDGGSPIVFNSAAGSIIIGGRTVIRNLSNRIQYGNTSGITGHEWFVNFVAVGGVSSNGWAFGFNPNTSAPTAQMDILSPVGRNPLIIKYDNGVTIDTYYTLSAAGRHLWNNAVSGEKTADYIFRRRPSSSGLLAEFITTTDNTVYFSTTSGGGNIKIVYRNTGDANHTWDMGRFNDGNFTLNHHSGNDIGQGTSTTVLSITTQTLWTIKTQTGLDSSFAIWSGRSGIAQGYGSMTFRDSSGVFAAGLYYGSVAGAANNNYLDLQVNDGGTPRRSIRLERDELHLSYAGGKMGLFGVTAILRPDNTISAAAFQANTSGINDDSATWGGYTGGQVVQALINLGALT